MVPLAKIKPRDGFNPRARVRRRADGRAGRVGEAARDHHAAHARPRRRRVRDHRRGAPLPGGEAGEAQGGTRAGARRRRGRADARRGRERDPRRPQPDRGGARLRAARRRARRHGEGGEARRPQREADRRAARPPAPARRGAGAARRAEGAARLRARADPDRGARAAARRPLRHLARGADPPPPHGSRPIPARSWTTCSRPSGRTTTASRSTRSPTASAATMGRSSRVAAAGTSSCRASWPSSASTASRSPPPTRSYRRSRRRTSTTGRHARPRSSASASASRSPTRTPTPRAPSAACSNYPARTDASTATSPTRSGSRTGSCQKIAAHASAEEERKQREREARTPSAPEDDPEKEARREQRQRDYEARVAGRARNLDLGAALARWQPKLDTDAVKLLGSLVLLHYGKAAAWAHRLCVEQPTTTNKQGKVTVRYPRGAQAEKRATRARRSQRLSRARTPEDALAVVLRLLVAQRLVDTDGLPDADRQGVYEPQELAASKVLDKLAAPRRARLGQAAPRRAGGRARTPRAGMAGTGRRRGSPSSAPSWPPANPSAAPAASSRSRHPTEAAEKHGSLVHARRLRAAVGQRTRRRRRPPDAPSTRLTNLNSTRDTDALDP